MDIEEIIQRVVDNGNVEDMHLLSDILEDTMEIIKKYDEDCYKKYEMELYKMAYGNTLSREMAKNIVSQMQPYGERWTMEEAKQIQEDFGIENIKPIDFFVVLNSKYNDNRDTVERFTDNNEEALELYICLTKDFILDPDAIQDKVFAYFTTIPE